MHCLHRTKAKKYREQIHLEMKHMMAEIKIQCKDQKIKWRTSPRKIRTKDKRMEKVGEKETSKTLQKVQRLTNRRP